MIKLPEMNLLSRTGVARDITRKIFDEVSEAKIEDKTTHILLREKISEQDAYHRVIQEIVDNFGEYAILSHTWLQDEDDSELTYGDVMRAGPEWPSLYTQANSAGYRKVSGFAKLHTARDMCMLGWTQSASTKTVPRSSTNPSGPCIVGINTLRCA